MAGSSNALISDDFKRINASSVNVFNFVSVKLSSYSDYNIYNIWKAQMLCLIESQELTHIINAEHPSTNFDMISHYDRLVKGWIFGTVEDPVLHYVGDSGRARELWMKLESIFRPPSVQAYDQTRALEYRSTLHVNVSDFVSMKLSGHSSYPIWKAQMICLIESQELTHIINVEYPFPGDKGVNMISLYDKLVKGWIFTTMNHQLLKRFIDYSSAQSIWRKLESMFNRPISDREGDVSALREDLKYIQVSNVNVSSFVSVKLSGPGNYKIWKAQMVCLLHSQELLHIIEVKTRKLQSGGSMTEKYDNLVKGWILGTMTDQLLDAFAVYDSVQFLWVELELKLNSPGSDREDSVGFTFGIESVPETEHTDSIRQKKRLFEASLYGSWWKTKSVLKVNKNAAASPITPNGNTILHLAVERGHNYLVEKLLEFIKDGKDIETKNDKGQTALHIAAMVDNTRAAQLLVQKRKELLVILDHDQESPLDSAFSNMKLNMSAYLLKSALSFDLSSVTRDSIHAIKTAIFTKQYNLARTLLENVPRSPNKEDSNLLMAITVNFPTDLGFLESFIYPILNNVSKTKVLKGSLLLFYNTLEKCVEDILWVFTLGKISMILFVPIATLYPAYELICFLFRLIRLTFSVLYFLLWKVLAVTVHPIKNIEKKKIEYVEAKRVLTLICDKMGLSHPGYSLPIIEAVSQGTYEVVDEILSRSPATINCTNEEGHNIIQLAIINRSEKVYNLIHHIIERTKSYRTMKDSFGNNLVHLAGRLAPSSALNRIPGAALQLQRELIWHEEVEKLTGPLELINKNFYNETPAMLFSREHKDLIKQGEVWMKTTAESCSITAALIVTVVFAAAITVPGGNHQESGIPVFKKEIAFTIFAVFNAFSLFTAATSLLLFLSILTARFSERDFLVILPRRLILGLFTLFLSTTAMIVAFGAILFLVFCEKRPWMLIPICVFACLPIVFCEKRPWMLIPICVFACLPISVIVTIKLPLLVDLIQSKYFPIFGKKRYLDHCKVSLANTAFTR